MATQSTGDPLPRALTWIAHHTLSLMILTMTGFLVSELSRIAHGAALAAFNFVGALMLAAYFTLISVERWHAYHLCVQCAEETPLDPAAVAQERKKTLRAFHWMTSFAVSAVVMVLAIGGNLLLLLNSGSNSAQQYHLVFSTFFYSYLLANGLAARWGILHSMLMPWCPYCQDGDDGEDEPAPEPTPDPILEKTL